MPEGSTFKLSWTFRLLGFFPLAFFLFHFWFHYHAGTPGHMLWMCNVSTATLAVGLLLAQPRLIRIATIWLIPGIPLWILDMVLYGMGPVSTFIEHIGGMTIGVFALSKVRAERWMWLYGVGWFVVVQQAARMLTSPELNVNTAFLVHSLVAKIFHAYWQYWLGSLMVTAICLWVMGWILNRLFPPHQNFRRGNLGREAEEERRPPFKMMV